MNEYLIYNSNISKTELEKLNIFISNNAVVEDDVKIYFNSCILGDSIIYKNAVIYNNTTIENSIIRTNVSVYSSRILNSEIDADCKIGPFANLKNATLSKGCKISNFVEVKNATISANTSISHLSSVVNCEIGKNCIIDGGVIFSSDDENKIYIGDDVHIQANSCLIAPLTIQDGAKVLAGSLVTKNVSVNETVKNNITQKNIL